MITINVPIKYYNRASLETPGRSTSSTSRFTFWKDLIMLWTYDAEKVILEKNYLVTNGLQKTKIEIGLLCHLLTFRLGIQLYCTIKVILVLYITFSAS